MKRYQIVAKFLWFWAKYKFNFIDADGYYGNQCVDLIRQYCKEVFGYNMPSLDKARNLSIKILTPWKWQEIYPSKERMKMGDIVSVDLIPVNKYGHIFIFYKETRDGFYYIDQNGIGGAGKKNADGSYPKKKGNGVEKRFAKRGKFKILKVFRYKS